MRVSITFISVFLLVIGSLSIVTFGQESESQPVEQPEGMKVFLNAKCSMCHSIESEKVQLQAGGFIVVKEKNVPPDLSGVGSKHDAEWIMKYLTQKETRQGVSHSRRFRGSEKELKMLALWLEKLKAK